MGLARLKRTDQRGVRLSQKITRNGADLRPCRSVIGQTAWRRFTKLQGTGSFAVPSSFDAIALMSSQRLAWFGTESVFRRLMKCFMDRPSESVPRPAHSASQQRRSARPRPIAAEGSSMDRVLRHAHY
jgi:hypothetical protein